MKQIVAPMVCAVLIWTAVLPGGNIAARAENAGVPHGVDRAAGEPAQAERVGSVKVRVLDLELLNQEGESVKFKSDVIGDKLIVMNFIYTTCTTACPILSLTFTRLQGLLGARLGAEVALVSVTVDPKTDTPARLKEFAWRHRAKPGWSFLTGDKSHITKVLSGLGVSVPRIDDHPVMILVGDGRLGVWTRHYGFPSPEQLLARLDELQLARRASGTVTTGAE